MKKNLLVCFLFLVTFQLHAADYYWVGGGGNWSDLNHWRLGSSTGNIPSIVPAAGDNVIFGPDAGFGISVASRTITVNSNTFCNNMTWTDDVPNAPIITQGSAYSTKIYGSLYLNPTVTHTLYAEMVGSVPATVKANGPIKGAIAFTMNKPGSGVTLVGDLINSTGSINFLAGYLDASNKDVSIYNFASATNENRSLNISNSTVNAAIWNYTGNAKTLQADGSFLTTSRLYIDNSKYAEVGAGSISKDYFSIYNCQIEKLTFNATSISSEARIHSGNTIESLIFKGSGYIGGSDNVVKSLIVEGNGAIGGNNNSITSAVIGLDASVSGSGNNITFMEVKRGKTAIAAGATPITFGTFLTAPNKGVALSGTTNITTHFRAGGAPCDGFTEITGTTTAILNFSAGATADIDNVLLASVKATGAIVPIAVNGIDDDGNSGFTITESAGTAGTLYWVGGAGDWDDKSHWSTISGGSGGACIPFKDDDVVFDANSGFTPSSKTVTTSSNTYFKNMTWASGVLNSPIFNESGAYIMKAYGSVILQESITMNADIHYTGANAATLQVNGNTLGTLIHRIVKTGAGGLALLDDWSNTKGSFNFTSGSLNLENRNLNIYSYVSSGSLPRSLNMKNATITTASLWQYQGTNKQIESSNSFLTSLYQIIIDGLQYPKIHLSSVSGGSNVFSISNSTITELRFTGNVLNNIAPRIGSGNMIDFLEFNGGGFMGANNRIGFLEFKGVGYITGSGNTFGTLLTASNQNYFFAGTTTITDKFGAVHPSCTGLGEIRGYNNGIGTIAFGPNAQVEMTNVYLENMVATGGGGSLQLPVAFSGADAGGNSGWAISSGIGSARYWVGGGGDWNDANHWSETSGGTGGACIPTVNDDVYFDGNSGFGTTIPTKTITVNNGNAYFHNMSWAGALNSPTLTKAAAWAMECWGNTLVLNPTITLNILSLQLKGSEATILSGQTLGNFDLDIRKLGGSLTIANDYRNKATHFNLYEGSFIAIGHTLDIASIDNNARTATMSVNIQGSTINGAWRFNGAAANHTLIADNSVINADVGFYAEGFSYHIVNLSSAVASNGVFSNTTIDKLTFTNPSITSGTGINGNNNKLGTVEFKGSGIIHGTGNEIETLIFFPGNTYTFTANTNTTITGDWFGSGTPCRPTEIKSHSTAIATVTKISGKVDFDYVRLQRISATGGASFKVGKHSTDQGGNSGWDIASYDGVSPILGLGEDLALNLSQFPYTLNTDGFFGSPLSQYVWSKDGNVISSGDKLIVTEPGTYKVDVTFPDGCKISDEIVVSRSLVDLSIAKTVDEATPDVGNNVVFKLVVTNEGPGEGTDIVVEDLLPAGYTYVSSVPEAGTSYDPATGVWTIGTLLPAENSTLTITATVNPIGPYENTATVTAAEMDPVLGNNSSTITPVPVPVADLSVLKTINVSNPYAGDEVVFTIVVSNDGPSNATAVLVKDLLPSGYAFVSAVPSVGSYNSGTGIWTVGNLAKGGNATLTLRATVRSTGVYANTAEVSGNEADRVPANNLATVTPTPIIVQINKVGPTTADAGTEITYVLSVTNIGTGNALDQLMEDIVPAELTAVTWTASALGSATVLNGATGSGNQVSVRGNIPAGGGNQISITIKGTIPASSLATSISNTATARAFAGGSPVVSSNAVATAISKQSDLHIQKNGPTTVVAGNEVSYMLEVTNAGPSNAKGLTITDISPTGLNNVNWTATGQNGATVNLASGTGNVILKADIPSGVGKILVNITGTLDAGYAGTNLVNTATAVLEAGAIDPTPATATVTSTVSRSANIRITKSGPANIGAGEDISYTLRVVNDGPSLASGIEIKDVLPLEIENVTWTSTVPNGATLSSASGNGDIDLTGDLPAGKVIEIEVKGKVLSSVAGGATFTNTATANLPVASSVTDPDLTSNSSSVATLVSSAADFTVSKSGPSTVNIGDPIHYTIVVRNGGLADITGATIEDIVPSEVTVTSWNIVGTGGATVTGAEDGTDNIISSTGDILADGDPLTALTLNVFGTVNETALLSINNEFTNKVEVSAGGDKSSEVTTTVNKSTDVSIEKNGPQSVTAGMPISYTIKVNNAGPIDVAGLVVEDLVPVEVENISWIATKVGSAVITNGAIDGNINTTNAINITADISSGAGNYILITVNGIVSSNPALTEITNMAEVSMPVGGAITDFNLINNTSTVVTEINKETDLAITKAVDFATPMVGSNVVFTLVATNKGPSVATGVEVTDLLSDGYTFVSSDPAADYVEATGIWTIGTLANGASETLTITAMVNASGPYENMATIAGLEADPDLANNTTSAITTPIPQAHLVTVKELKDGAQLDFIPGDAVLYTIRVENHGPSAAGNVNIKDIAPLGTQISAWTAIPSAGVIYPNASGTGNLNATIAVLAKGTAAIYEVEVKTPSDFASALVNTVSVSSTTKDSNPGACVGCTTQPLPSVGKADIVTVKTLKDLTQTTFVPGEEVVYIITVTNNGPSDAQVVKIKDSAPAGTSISGWTAKVTSGTFTLPNASGTGNLDETIASLPNGVVVSYEVKVKTSSGFIGNLVNLVSVTSITDDPDPTCAGCETAPITAVPSADLVTLKTTTDVTQTSFIPGEVVVYTIRVTNNGPSDAQNVNIKDVAPAGTNISAWTAKVVSGTVLLPNLSGVGNLDETIVTLPNGAVVSYEIMVQIPASFIANLSNTAVVTSSTDDPDLSCGTCTTSPLTAEITADLSIEKTVDNATPVVGENVVFTLVAQNDGPSDGSNVIVIDKLPTGYTYDSDTAPTGTSYNSGTGIWDIGSMISGSNKTLTIRAKVNPAGDYRNLANIAAAGTVDPDETNNLAEVSVVPVPADPKFTLVKTFSINSDVAVTPFTAVGDEITYSITVANTGNVTLTNVSVEDPLPNLSALSYSWPSVSDPGTLTPGQYATATATYSITEADLTAGRIKNTAMATGNGPDGPLTPVSSNLVTVYLPKMDDCNGEKTIYRLDVDATIATNPTINGSGGTIDVVFKLVSGVAIPGIGNTFTRTITYTGLQGGRVWEKLAKATNERLVLLPLATDDPGGIYSGLPANNLDEYIDDLGQVDESFYVAIRDGKLDELGHFDISLGDLSDLISTLPSGVSIVNQNATTRTIGNGTYDFGEINNGYWMKLVSQGEVRSGGDGSATPDVIVPWGEALTYRYSAFNDGRFPITGHGDDRGWEITSDIVFCTAISDLAITKSVDNPTPDVGSDVVFILTVTNNGPSTATHVEVVDVLPSGYTYKSDDGAGAYVLSTGLWTIGSIVNGESVALNIIATVNATGDYKNTASVEGTEKDPDPTNNTDKETLTPVPVSDLAITKMVDNATPEVGSDVVFTLTVTNNGPSDATDVLVTDKLPSGYTYKSDDGAGAYVSSTGLWTVGTLTNGESILLNITASVNATGDYRNTARVEGTEKDPIPSNDEDGKTINPQTVIVGSPELAFTKEGQYVDANNDGVVSVGDRIDYTFTVENKGNIIISGLVINDSRIGVFNLPVSPSELVKGQKGMATAFYLITQNDINAGGVWNLAIVTGEDSNGNSITEESRDPNPLDPSDPTHPGINKGCEDCTITPLPREGALTITKTTDRSKTYNKEGEVIVYTIVVSNRGNVTLTNVVVTDDNADNKNVGVIPKLGVGESITITAHHTITRADIDRGYVYNQAFANGKDSEGKDVEAKSKDTKPIDPGVPIDPECPACTITPIEGQDFFIPNVFTPNGDGRNDTFEIVGLESYDHAEVTIFNRWGNEVYRNMNYKNNWDGNNLNEGTYYYLVVLKKEGRESVHKGWVLLKR